MVRRLRAVYSGRQLVPQEPCDIPEGAVVDLIVEDATVVPARVVDEQERRSVLRALVERMRNDPFSANAPRWTRDQLHERR